MTGGKLPDGGILYDGTEEDDDIVVESDAPRAVLSVDWSVTNVNETGLVGAELIGEFVKQLPNSPGVYRMLNAEGDVLYVGKARSLKKRVSNYAQGRLHSNRLTRMVRETANMEFVTTRTEVEALLLEANLIKRLRPRFNVLLRDDKSFPYILITGDSRAPAIYKHRGARGRKGDYFGPFASASAVGRTINSLQRAFLLRTCTDSVFESRTRPCLLFQIKRCSGPCTHEISDTDYAELVREAKDFLSGKSQNVKASIAAAMNEAAENLDFERAAVFRDRLAGLSHVQSHQGINPANVEEADVFAIHHEGGLTCIQVFFFRAGQNWGNQAYFPKADPQMSSAEVLNAFLAQFYDDKPCPRLILLSEVIEEQELLAMALTERAGYRVQILVPQRGDKKDVVDHVTANAREAHGRKLAETASQGRLLQGFAETFSLPYVPRRIEIYDNSHIMGTNAVGGMVVAGPEGFVKGQYRKFNIKSEDITPGDDFGMMREVMTRRFSRLLKEEGKPDRSVVPDDSADTAFPAWPDVILIDGGQGQMTAVRAILDELGISDSVTAIGVAKGVDRDAGRERFFALGRPDFTLPPRDPVLYFIQRLRDEAHRFAIGSHRARRKKEMVRNPLDEIAGIGPTRKRALLQHFGTAKAVSRAAVSDLTAVEGISEAVARLIYNHFHENAAD
ncbi:MAG: excinuclease ABC subunit UvrC [Alphaproteobacteria bacterium]|nr:excinuclease ABC subunit UvrC [Rhizobiaceae bacterium]MBU3960825.1 excinuclease ABC subunit UvrC [Alphaproteobacteria bacterium]MBU4050168.1 excinuclease ABC subunit UvrC [Alphaproteobacteria bacterium]MBU4091442.1 excinuclease ABC subunit UvrC [Alphaproteobacteria bacterium]MBU4158100.1 excinuclease ABC subunit UvrC [Alphaproteobacteria bacterium]